MDDIDGVIFFDAEYRRGGPSSYALVANDVHIGGPISSASDNNDAEWQAACQALRKAKAEKWMRILCIGDSALVIAQASGGYPALADLRYKYLEWGAECRDLAEGIDVTWLRMSSRRNPAGREIRRVQARAAYRRRKSRHAPAGSCPP